MKYAQGKPFLLLLGAVGFLGLVEWLHPTHIGALELKPVALLADIETVCETQPIEASLAQIEVPETPTAVAEAADTVPEGITPIIDYADSTTVGMAAFYQALQQRNTLQRPVRIAYYGDSFIEGDILTADLRALLQSAYGGAGIGYTEVHPPFADCRITALQRSEGWDVRHILMKDSCENRRLGLSQRYAIPMEGAFTEVHSSRNYAHLDSCEVALCYVQSQQPMTIRVRKNRAQWDTLRTEGNGEIEVLPVYGHLKQLRWYFPADSTATCHGVALEGKGGIVLDNLSFRGTSGTSLNRLPQQQWDRWAKVRPYDLIVLHYGLNVASKEVIDYAYYNHAMKKVVQKLKKAYPHTAILIVSVSDREDRIDGKLQTLPGVRALVKFQQKLAAEEHVAYWNLYEAMGGEGSIVRMTEEKPKGARMDYTHITPHGGKQIAERFFETLNYGFQSYLEP